MPRIPDPTTWVPEKLSQRRIADYKPFSMVDGEGVRCSLYVSGCLFACEGCFNEAAWSFRYGNDYDDALRERIVADTGQSYVQGLSLLGGEPFLNTWVCLDAVRAMRAAHGDTKDVWCWTGYTLETLLAIGTDDQLALLNEVDVLIDGPFTLSERDLLLQFRGSRNQRVLDVPASLAAGHAVGWARLRGAAAEAEQIDRRQLI